MKREVVALAVATIVLAGCSKSKLNSASGRGGEKFFAITAETADFYYYGPQQASGPDKKLEKGTLMTLIRPSFGYCKVKLLTGEQGFVANEDVGVASNALIAAATSPPPSRSARFRLDSPDPRLVMPPEPLPEFEPTPIPDQPPSDQ